MCNVYLYIHRRQVSVKLITENTIHNILYYSILSCNIVCWKVKRSRIFGVGACRCLDFGDVGGCFHFVYMS